MPGITYSLGLTASSFHAVLGAAQGALARFRGAVGALGGLGGLTGGLIGGATAALALKSAIEGAANAETLQLQFETMLKSAGAARRLTAEIQKFTDTTPFEMPEIAQAARTLLAFGGTSKTVISELRMLGDIAAGTGGNVGELAQVFGKVRVQGRLSGEVIEQFTVRGIPLIGMLAKQLGKSAEEIRKMVEEGKIGFPQVSAVMAGMTGEGGKFFEGTKKLAGSAAGLWSTFTDTVRAVLREFGKPVLVELKTALAGAIELASGLLARARQFGETIATWVRVGRELFATGELGSALGLAVKLAMMEGANVLVRALQAGLSGAGAGFGELFKGIVGLLAQGSTWSALFDGIVAAGASVADALAAAIRSSIPGLERTAREVEMRRTLRAGSINDLVPGLAGRRAADPALDRKLRELAGAETQFGPSYGSSLPGFGKIEGDDFWERVFREKKRVLEDVARLSGLSAGAANMQALDGAFSRIWQTTSERFASAAGAFDTAPVAAALKEKLSQALASDVARSPGGIAGMALFITQALEEMRAATEEAAPDFTAAAGGTGGARRALTDRLREIGAFVGGQGPNEGRSAKDTAAAVKKSAELLAKIEQKIGRVEGGVF